MCRLNNVFVNLIVFFLLIVGFIRLRGLVIDFWFFDLLFILVDVISSMNINMKLCLGYKLFLWILVKEMWLKFMGLG